MHVRRDIKFILAASFAFGISISVCHGEEASGPDFAKITLPGALLRASNVAYGEFSVSLQKIDYGDELGLFTRAIENYNVRVEERDDSYFFLFSLNPFHGRLLKGGGASFIIQKGTYKVLNVLYYK